MPARSTQLAGKIHSVVVDNPSGPVSVTAASGGKKTSTVSFRAVGGGSGTLSQGEAYIRGGTLHVTGPSGVGGSYVSSARGMSVTNINNGSTTNLIQAGVVSSVSMSGDGGITIGGGGGGVEVIVEVPRGTSIQVKTDFGDIDVYSGGGDDVSLSTGAGDIELCGTGATRASLKSGSGRIRVREGDFGKVAAQSGSGDIRFDKAVKADVTARSGSGRVTLHNRR